MKISTRTRYGTRLMLYLGLHYGNGPIFLKDIAKEEDISEKYLSQIIILLKNAGLVNATRGAHGGYMLSKDPSEITIENIVQTLEGSLNLVECINNSTVCKKSVKCTTRVLWCKLEQKMRETLHSITLADLINMHNTNKQVAMYTI